MPLPCPLHLVVVPHMTQTQRAVHVLFARSHKVSAILLHVLLVRSLSTVLLHKFSAHVDRVGPLFMCFLSSQLIAHGRMPD